jgi:alkylation response protein AidB-like acyl-CoA dehydrogenase
MALVNEPGLGPEAQELLDLVERFAREEMRPVGTELDLLADPQDVIASASPLWAIYDRYRQLGIDEVRASGAFSPTEQALLGARIEETLGWGDAGLAISFAVSNFHRFFVPLTGDADLMGRYLADDSVEIGCWAVTEPDHGSDSLAFTEPAWSRPDLRANCIARRDGDEYVIKGSKAAWVSNGTIATVAALFCTIDGDEGFAGGGVCIVPLDDPRVSRGRNLDKLGQRALPQGEIHFDDVRIPANWMIVGKEGYSLTIEMVLAMANAYMGSTFAGVARAAYELASDYARTRIQGGVPIIEHQSVRSRLFKMFTRVEAAQSLSRRVHLIGSATGAPPVEYSIASKTFCTTTAFEVASEALQIFGGNGLTKEYPIEKILRDARAAMIEDGCNEMLSLIGGARL